MLRTVSLHLPSLFITHRLISNKLFSLNSFMKQSKNNEKRACIRVQRQSLQLERLNTRKTPLIHVIFLYPSFCTGCELQGD